jgi:LCP family protein required for cell wall assembly
MGTSSDIERAPEPPPGPGDPTPIEGRRPARRRVLVGVGVLVVVVLAATATVVWWADRQFAAIPTFAESAPGYVDVGDDGTLPPDTAADATGTTIGELTSGIDGPTPVVPSGPRGVTYLVFSTGSRGLDASDAQHLQIPADRASMADGLTDSIMLAVVYPATGQVGELSIPRDLYIPQIGDRINTIYNRSGPRALAVLVAKITGMPVDHMVAVNFSAFGDLTDAVGGVDLWVDGPARDLNTGFHADHSGCMHMDAATALAFARSRHWEVGDGVTWRLDASADDFGRIRRQQRLIRAAGRKLATPAGIGKLSSVAAVAQRDLIVDPDLDLRDASSTALGLLRSDQTTIQTFSYAGTPGWAGAASVVYTNAAANAGPLAAMQRLLAGQPVDASAGGSPTRVSVPGAAAPVPTAAPAPADGAGGGSGAMGGATSTPGDPSGGLSPSTSSPPTSPAPAPSC